MKKQHLVFNAKMKVEMIFTFDNKDQQLWRTTMRVVPIEMKESEWIRSLIKELLKDLQRE